MMKQNVTSVYATVNIAGDLYVTYKALLILKNSFCVLECVCASAPLILPETACPLAHCQWKLMSGSAYI